MSQGSAVIWTDELRSRFDGLLDEYRSALHASLEGLTEEQARMRLVPSKTTLLGLLKHVTYVEGVWFDQAVTGRTYQQIAHREHPGAVLRAHKLRHHRVSTRGTPTPVRGVTFRNAGTEAGRLRRR